MADTLLIVFVKHPIAGQVKTRLAKGIGHDKALQVYQALLQHTRSLADQGSFDTAIFYGNEVPEMDLWTERDWTRKLQQGADLGVRMLAAFRWAIAEGYGRVVLIGSDCAKLELQHLEAAFEHLKNHDLVVGPAEDGGYYLIGMKKAYAGLFEDKQWSTKDVFTDLQASAQALGLSISLLATLSDVDTIEDLRGTFLESFLD